MLDLLAENWMIILVICLVADMPLLFAVFYFLQQRRVRAAENWSVTLGEIVESEVCIGRGRRGSVNYSPLIVYEYEVMGQAYRGERISFGVELASGIRSWAHEKVAEYPVGKRIEVYYDPNDPANAVLEKTATPNKTLRFVLILTVLGSLLAVGIFIATFALINNPS